MPNNVMEVISGIVGELKQIASADSIIGEPVTIGNRTVVPIVKVSVGFGAGGGEGEKDSKSGYGAGGGGGCIVEPAAFIIMDETGISLLPAKPGKIDSIVEAIPGVVKKLMNLKGKFAKPDDGESADADNGDEPEA